MAAKKSRATLKVVPPVSSLEASIPNHVQRRAAKIHIDLEMKNVGDGEPYIALDKDEFDSFSDSWCSQCKHGNNEKKPCCYRERGAISGNELPEWLWYNGLPLCKAFEYEIETVDHNWKPHVSSIAYSAPSVNYEPMAYCGNGLNELVANSMMSHWCHACDKKDYCAGYKMVMADKDDLPSYWLWVDKRPVCTEFSPKEIVVQVAAQGVLVQPASTYRGYSYWVETIASSGLYAGFYQLIGAKKPSRLGHDQTSVVMAGRILRDAIDEVASVPSLSAKTGQWAADYVVHFPAMSYKK